MQRIISDIQYSQSFVFAENRARLKDGCLKECDNIAEPFRDIIVNLVKENIPSMNDVHILQQNFFSFKKKVESLQQSIISINDFFYAYKKISDERELFNDKEYEELSSIFSGQGNNLDYMSRYKYWSVIYNLSAPNSLKQTTAKLARDYYSNKLDQNE